MSLNITPPEGCTDLLLDLLALEGKPDEYRVIGVTSAVRGEGRSSLAVTLSESLAKDMQQPTLLIDMDIDHGELAAHYSFNYGFGLSDLLLDNVPPDQVLHKVGSHLNVIGMPWRGLRLSAVLLEKGLPLDGLAETLGKPLIVILDLPPLLDSPYGVQMAGLANHLVMAVRADVTPTATIKAALARLDQAGYRDRLAGTVLVGTKQRAPGWLGRLGLR